MASGMLEKQLAQRMYQDRRYSPAFDVHVAVISVGIFEGDAATTHVGQHRFNHSSADLTGRSHSHLCWSACTACVLYNDERGQESARVNTPQIRFAPVRLAELILSRECLKRILKALPIGLVVLACFSNCRVDILVGFADNFRGCSEREGAVGDNFPLRHKCARAYKAVLSDSRAIQDRRIHSDQGAFADRATMQHRFVTDRAPLAYFDGKSRVGMKNAVFLDVAAFANDDRFIVAANRCSEPNGYAALDDDVADHAGVRRDPEFARLRQLRLEISKCVYCQSACASNS